MNLLFKRQAKMNGPSSFPTPDASPIIATLAVTESQRPIPPQAPPVVAPPIVRPVYFQGTEFPPAEPSRGDRFPSRSRRLLNVMLGGLCLVAGIVAAQNPVLPTSPTRSFALADAARLAAIDKLTSAVMVEVSPAQPALAAGQIGLASSPSIPNTGVHDKVTESSPNVTPFEKAIDQIDDLPQNAAELRTLSSNASSTDHALISLSSTTQQRQPLEKVNPAAVLEAIIAARASPKSLPRIDPQSAIIPAPQCKDATCRENTRSLDTVLSWAKTPADAYRQAGEAEKLVFLIHVSGNFEIPGFT